MFRAVAVAIVPALLLLAIELCLRVVGYGYPAGAIVECTAGSKPAYCGNRDFAKQFFPVHVAREFSPFAFPAQKSDSTYRIFVLGASAAQGVPDPAYSFGRILQVMLEARYPGVDVEVITAAMVAINSHVVLPVARSCADHDPDLFVVYLGNNEVVGPYGPGTVFSSASSSLRAIRARLALGSTRMGQLADRVSRLIAGQDVAVKGWHGLGMFLEKQIAFDSPALASVYSHFEKNLADICEAGVDAGAKVILCSVGSNLKDCPPFASLHSASLTPAQEQEWDELYRQGVAHETAGQYAQAVQSFLAAAQIDSRYAELQFRLGRCYWTMADYAAARQRYLQARDLDTLRFRPDTRINQVIRSVATGREGVHFADAAAAFDRNSPHGITGAELFHEHVHLTFPGNCTLARAVADGIATLSPARLARAKSVGTLLTEGQCAEALAYTDWDRHKIARKVLDGYILKPPFTNQLYHRERVEQLEAELAALDRFADRSVMQEVAARYQTAVAQRPADWQLRMNYSQFLAAGMRDYEGATEQLRTVVEQFPYYSFYARLGTLLHGQRKFAQAEAMFRKSLATAPSFQGHLGLARLLRTRQQSQRAIAEYRRALELRPGDSVGAYQELATVLQETGRDGQAASTLRDAIRVFPEDKTALCHYSLALLLDKQGNIDEGIREIRKALKGLPDKDHPDHALFSRALEKLLNQQGGRPLIAAGVGVATGGLEQQASSPGDDRPDRVALLLAQAQFVRQTAPDGKVQFVPGAAKLTFVYPNGHRWKGEVLEDPDSNVFHKAMPFDLPGAQPGILTIGANEAPLPALAKIWRRTGEGWRGVVLSQATFGGRFNRYRDVEIGDVTGDGRPEIVIATHDQGAVGVLHRKGLRWEATIIDQAQNTFVHEIEIGDVDGDGLNEIFATLSAPNRRDGTPQPGRVVMYRYDGREFSRQVVEAFEDCHAKEILVAKVRGAGPPDLYAVLEPRFERGDPRGSDRENVQIREYRFTQPNPVGALVATLPDKKCRFLHAGDVDHDGQVELVASAFKAGIWMIKPEGDRWVTHLIDSDPSGYVHASALADLDGDGRLEIYCATDDKQQLRRYRWTGRQFERTDLFGLTKGDITFDLMPCLTSKCLSVQ